MRSILCIVLLVSVVDLGGARAATVRFDAAGDPFERASVFRLDLDLPVVADRGVELGAGYGQRSFWTIANSGDNDRVETDFAPRVFLRSVRGPWTWQGGYEHESNGRLDAASRSWNRLVGRVRRVGGRGSIEVAAWYAFRVEDTNPDLRRTVGDGVLILTSDPDARWGGALHVGFTLDPPDDGPITNVRAECSVRAPRWLFEGDRVRGLVEVFWGRGESLLRNDEIARAIRFGLRIER